jgi:starch-binding outer membrane protein, SusD/RagB family
MACNDLDLQPLDRVTTETYYKTPGDFDGAMFAAYSSLQDLYGTSTETLGENGEFWKLTLVITDDVDSDRNRAWDAWSNPIDDLLLRASDAPYQSVYAGIYEGILRSNLVIEAAEGGNNELTDDQKKLYVGEAKFMRAFYHFLAMQLWGTPPLVTEVKKDITNLSTPNSTKDEMFTAILADLGEAFNGLPEKWDDSNLGRATKWTAKAFEGKVLVWKKEWAKAIEAFAAVEGSGKYSLTPNYEDAFSFTNENGSESLFEIQYGGPFSDDNLWVFDDTHSEAFKASQGAGRAWYWDASGDAPGGKLGFWVPSQSIVDEYEAGDPRLGFNIYKAGDTYYTNEGQTPVSLPYDPAWSSTGYTIKKYRGEKNSAGGNYAGHGQADFNNERWMRYAEVLLLHAEALIESGNVPAGMDIINNQIRARVGLGDSPIADATEALRHERRVEMAFEPHRWFDITRWGIGAEVFGAKWDDKFNVLPFPQSAIDRSGGVVKQNPGY